MKKLLIKSVLFSLILTVNYSILPKIVFAKENIDPSVLCKTLNNQDLLYEGISGDMDNEGTGLTNDLSNKLLVITEEPMGQPDNQSTFRCYRQIVCTTTQKEVKVKTDAGKDGQSANTKEVPVKECETTFESSSCLDKASSNMIGQNTSSEDFKDYTICEPVMVYLADAGTDLLYTYIGKLYRYFTWLGSILAVLLIIVAGIMRVTAGDNTNQITTSTGLITKSLTGLVVLYLAAFILHIINPNFFII